MPSLRLYPEHVTQPIGWYQVGWSHEVRAGSVMSAKLCGHDLVVMRTESGALRVHDAYCPHRGANLAVGGEVCGEELVCPFHAWRFGPDGVCSHIPGTNKVPPRAKLRRWRVVEEAGLIMVHFDPEGTQTDVPFSGVEELVGDDWSAPVTKHETFRARLQDVVENGADTGHFAHVHGMPESDVSLTEADGTIRMSQASRVRRMGLTFHSTLDMRMTEPGLTVSRVGGVLGAECVVTSGITPLDDENLIVRSTYRIRRMGPLTQPLVRTIAHLGHQVFCEDVPIWNNQLHLERPVLSELDRNIAQFRRWFERFPVAQAA